MPPDRRGKPNKVTATANRVMGCARDVLTQLEHEQLLERDPPRVDNSRGPRLEIRKREAVEPSPKQGPTHRSELEEILTAATSIYQRHLREQAGKPALEFLRSRRIGEEAATRWKLGYAPPSWEGMTSALSNKGFTDEIQVESGVVGRARNGRLYDRMRGRLIFPILDQPGAPRGFKVHAVEQ